MLRVILLDREGHNLVEHIDASDTHDFQSVRKMTRFIRESMGRVLFWYDYDRDFLKVPAKVADVRVYEGRHDVSDEVKDLQSIAYLFRL